MNPDLADDPLAEGTDPYLHFAGLADAPTRPAAPGGAGSVPASPSAPRAATPDLALRRQGPPAAPGAGGAEPPGAAAPEPMLQSATVGLVAAEDGGAAALARLTGALRDGTAFVAAEDAPFVGSGGDASEPFTLFWRDQGFLDRMRGVVEVLHRARPIALTTGTRPVPDDLRDAARRPSARIADDTLPDPDLPPVEATGAATRAGLRTQNGPHPAPIVAVIDDGIAFLNARFCKGPAAGPLTSRLQSIWLQAFRTVAGSGGGTIAGRVLHRVEIDALLARGSALEEAAVYRALNRQLLGPDAHRSTEFGFAHGTHILDTAGGGDPGRGPDWPLLAVQLPPEAVDDTAGTSLEPCIVRGVAWILGQAERSGSMAPVVINVSFATFAGPKDGTKAIEALVARRLSRWQARTGRVARVVYAFGNARLTRQGARMPLSPGGAERIDWRLQPEDRTPCYMELRPEGGDPGALTLTLTAPGGRVETLGPLEPETSRRILDARGHTVGRLYHLGPRPTAPGIVTPAHLVLALRPTHPDAAPDRAAAGAWGLRLETTTPMTLRLEIQRGDTPLGYRENGRQSYLDHPAAHAWDPERKDYGAPGGPITRQASHSSFVTAPGPMTLSVGAARGDTRGPSPYSAEGAPWTRAGPTLAALGDRGAAAGGMLGAGTGNGATRALNGTSVAAARATRAIAEVWAAQGPQAQPDPEEIARLIADRGDPCDPALLPRQGAGVLSRTSSGTALG